MPPKNLPAGDADASRRALRSIDALHRADAATLNAEVGRLHRFVRLRRVLYYSVLAPFGWLSRRIPRLAQTVSVTFAFAVLFIIWGVLSPVVRVLLAYYIVGYVAYFAVSMRLAKLLDLAAESVGLSGHEVLQRWADDSGARDDAWA